MKYLFCLLIPAGLFLLIISIKYVIRFAKSEMIYEMPYSRGTGTFTLAARGKYGLWLSGKKFKKAPLGEFGLTLVNRDTGQSVPLCAPLLRTAVTGLSKSRLKLYSFQAEAGTYTVSLNDEVRIRDKACAFLVNAVTNAARRLQFVFCSGVPSYIRYGFIPVYTGDYIRRRYNGFGSYSPGCFIEESGDSMRREYLCM